MHNAEKTKGPVFPSALKNDNQWRLQMKVGDTFTRDIYSGNLAEVTVRSVDEDGYRYEIAFHDGRKGSGFKSWANENAEKEAKNVSE